MAVLTSKTAMKNDIQISIEIVTINILRIGARNFFKSVVVFL